MKNMEIRKFNPLDGGVLEGIAKVLGDTTSGLTGSEISKFLKEVNIIDTDPHLTKWIRLYNAFDNHQNKNRISNSILKFINKSMNPSRYVGRNEQFEDMRFELNKRLAFNGLNLLPNGKFTDTNSSSTIHEAEQKAVRLKSKLEQRNSHPNIYKYCKRELLAENYFHSVFEAVKSIADIIRIETGLISDGGQLVDDAFSTKNPLLKINDLSSETKQSEQKGFANLIKGVFGMFRNTTAHAPKITWEISEDDALDIMSTISLIHRKLELAKKSKI